jgi:hypothetical protein
VGLDRPLEPGDLVCRKAWATVTGSRTTASPAWSEAPRQSSGATSSSEGIVTSRARRPSFSCTDR